MRLARSGKLIYDESLYGRFWVFEDRLDAGRKLADALREISENFDLIMAIPRGGIPVAFEVAREFGVRMDILIARKILIPWNREAGFGAVSPDGRYFVDEELARILGLGESEIEEALREQMLEIESRKRILRLGKPYERLNGTSVVVVDDGIAAGYTMVAAVEFLRRMGAEKVLVAVPTACQDTLGRLENLADLIVALNLRRSPFAVADAYKRWRDLDDSDVLKILEEARKLDLLAF